MKTQKHIYDVDRTTTSITVDYADDRVCIEHTFAQPGRILMANYYRNTATVWAVSEGQQTCLGQSNKQASDLHDLICLGIKKFRLKNNRRKELIEYRSGIDAIQNMDTLQKAMGIICYLAQFEAKIDNVVEKRDRREIAVKVRTHPTSFRQTGYEFTLHFMVPRDLIRPQFSKQQIVDSRDPLVRERIEQESYSPQENEFYEKITVDVDKYISIFNSTFVSAENVLFEGRPFTPEMKIPFSIRLSPVLKAQAAAALMTLA